MNATATVPDRPTIERLRVRWQGSAPESTISTRFRVERLLAEVDFRAFGLSPGVAVIIRHVRVTAPGLVGSTSSREWSARMQQALSDLLRGAVRPAMAAADNAACVIFADAAERLVCLTRDVVRGQAWERWYWQETLRDLPRAPGPVLTASWAAEPRFLPRALALLSPAETVAAVALLTQTETERVIQAVQAAHDLTPVRVPVIDHADTLKMTAPWQDWLPVPRPMVSPRATYLLGVGLGLARAPAKVRSQAFTAQATRWLARHETNDASPPAVVTAESSFSRVTGEEVDWGQSLPTPPSVTAIPSHHPRRAMPEAEIDMSDASQSTPQIMDDAVQSDTADLSGEGAATNIGGVLFLTHLLHRLDLPSGWAEGNSLAEYLSGWGLIELLGRFLLSSDHNRFADDPLWEELADLAGRAKGDRLGIGLPRPEAFRLPPPLVQRFGDPSPIWKVSTVGQRVRLFDAASGYLIADVPRGDRPLPEVVETEVKQYCHPRFAVSAELTPTTYLPRLEPGLSARLSPGAAWWLRRAGSFTRHVAQRTLGQDESSDLGEMLLKRGQILVSGTHVDLVLEMSQVNSRVRRAGFDLDPGWVPDLGRIVLFHYEG